MSAYSTLPLTQRPALRSGAPHGTRPGAVGYLHSVETFGTLDGPGIRYVLFFQGCHLRCLFCQNRDTWERAPGRVVTVDELLREVRRYQPYMDSSGGGITASGGDPILQPEFVGSLFAAARSEGIHTALDTSGLTGVTPAVQRLLADTDLVLLDVKHVDPEEHRRLTGRSNERIVGFARHLARIDKPVWIRHVVVPGFTDTPESARATAEFLRELPNVKRVDLLPYHAYGAHKWEALGERYPLEGVEPPAPELVRELAGYFADAGLPVAFAES
ncbi:MAG: pyruvate formate-lyase-activating protein [Spirochaetota bacterium]